MSIVQINNLTSGQWEGSTFGGLSQLTQISEGQFSDEKNLTSKDFPAIGTRNKRGEALQTMTKPHGIYWKNGLAYVDGTGFYYGGSKKFDVTDTDKILTGIGAYIAVWPDKIIYNTKNGEITRIEKTWTQAATATFEPLSSGSTFVKITCTGIGSNFNKYDSVKISGVSIDAMNKDAIIQDKEANFIVVISEEMATQIEKSWGQTTRATISAVGTVDKIECSGIGANFAVGDQIKITGCQVPGLNMTTTITERGTNYIRFNGIAVETQKQNTSLKVRRTRKTQTSGIQIKRTAPDMDFMCEMDNRLWGCSSANHEIYASKLGDPSNWNAFEGISTDSYAATIGTDGNFTGAVKHLGYVLFLKEDCIHKVFGNKPSNIQINTYQCEGLAAGSEKSLCIVGNTLFYVSRNGIRAFDGSLPYDVAPVIREKITESAGGTCNGIYYLSILNADGKRKLLTFDTNSRTWNIEDDLQIKFSAYGNGKLYIVDGDNVLREITSDESESNIEWYAESGDLIEWHRGRQGSAMDKKQVIKMKISAELSPGSYMEVLVKVNNDLLWKRVALLKTDNERKVFSVPFVPNRCDHYRIRLQGRGPMKLLGVKKYVRLRGGR